MFESANIDRYIEKFQALPLRRIFALVIISFLAASIMSSIVGWWLMGHAKRVAVSVQNVPESISITPPQGASKEVVESILARNLFNSQGLTGEVADKAAGGEIARSQLALKVVGIIYGGTPFTGIAMIENIQSKSVNSFMVGDQILAEAVLEEVQRDLILIRTLGHLEFLALDEIELRRSSRTGGGKKKRGVEVSGGGATPETAFDNFKEEGFERKGKNVEMTAEYKNTLLGPGLANVLQDAKASPNMVDGVLKGWRMDQIKAESFYAKSGMQNGDIALEINGVVLSDAGQSIKLLKDLKNESEIDIKLNRNGVDFTITLKVR